MRQIGRVQTRFGPWLGATLVLISLLGTPPHPVMADGGDIAYIANDRHSIRLVQADGSNDKALLSTDFVGNIAWSPDGKMLAYTIPNQTSRPPIQQIFLYDIASSKTSELKSSLGTTGPIAYFPDGKRLVVSGNQNRPPLECPGQTVAIELATGKAAPLALAGGCFLGGLQVAPDGLALIVSLCTTAPSCSIVNVSLASGETTLITAPPDDQGLPLSVSGVVASDNQSLAYIAKHTFAAEGASGDVVITDRDGSNARVAWQGQLGSVAFAPDSARLAVTALSSDATASEPTEDIWVLGVDGSNPHRVASGHNPTWRTSGALAAGPAPANNSGSVDAQKPAAEQAQAGARVLEAHSPSCLPRCFTFLYVVQGDTVWQPLPGKLSPADLAKLQHGPDLHVTLSVPRNEPAQLFILDDGTELVKLYLVQGDTAWLVVPQEITDQQMGDLGKLNTDGTLEGPLPQELLGLAGSPVEAPPATEPASTVPDTLTDSVRTDILAAVDRANAAWTAASRSLDPTSLKGNVAGQELSDDLAQIDSLRNQGHTQTNVNTSFSVVDITLDAAGHATVHTRETWSAETHAADSGQLLQRTPPTTYQETYTVEYQDAGWIVTKNDVS